MEGVPPYPPALQRKYKQRRWWLGETIIQAFDRTCDIYTDKEAVVEGQHRLTFSQLREKTKQAALAFSHLGIGKEDCVLLQVPNWVESFYIYLGLQRVGAIPIMCLPRHGKRELEQFCTLTQAKAWFGPATLGKTDYMPLIRDIKEEFPSLEHAIVVRGETPPDMISLSQLMEDSQARSRPAKLKYAPPTNPNDVMHLGPTGGTTGLPKLVPKTHNNHLTKAYYFARTLDIGPREVILAFAPINHDATNLLAFCTTALFGSTTILSPSTRIEDILEIIQRERITYCFFVPALLTDLLHFPDMERYNLSSLNAVQTGGAHCPAELVRLALKKFKCRFHSGYGMTEGAGNVTRAYDSPEVIVNTVGKKICPYDEYIIVDDKGHEVPAGEEGELASKGPCIVSGYYKAEEENRLGFTPQGFLRTGDLARFDQFGNLTITGRKKDVINRGGEKVSAYEVEEMLLSYPKVLRAAAIGMPDPRLGERICAYLQAKDQQTIDTAEILAYLKGKGASLLLLPERIEIVSELPFTAMDKVDKKKLKEDITQKLRAEGKLV